MKSEIVKLRCCDEFWDSGKVNKRWFYCIDCRKESKGKDYYSLHDELWDLITLECERKLILCWTCAKTRAKRELTIKDLKICPCNRDRYFLLTLKHKKALRRASRKALFAIATYVNYKIK